jgi:cell division protein FtsL
VYGHAGGIIEMKYCPSSPSLVFRSSAFDFCTTASLIHALVYRLHMCRAHRLFNFLKKEVIMNTRLNMVLLLAGVLIAAPAVAAGHGGGYRFNQKNTPGWSLMTPEERTEFHDKMMATKSYEECKKVQAEHHEKMMMRAKEKGVTLNSPRAHACDRMKARGMFK